MASADSSKRSLADGILGDRRKTLLVLGLIVVAFLLAGLVAEGGQELSSVGGGDSKFYEIMVKQWLTKGVYAYKRDTPNAVVTPGYPVVLAAVYKATGYADRPGGPYRLIFWIQLLFAAGSVALTYFIGEELLGRGPGLLAAALMAAFPPMIGSATDILTEPLAMLLFLGFLYAQLRAMRRGGRWLYALAGALAAWVVMVRPSFLPLAALPFAYELLRRPRRWKTMIVPVALFVAAFAVVVSPWVARNAISLHRPMLLPNGRGDPVLAGVDPYHWELGPAYRYSGPSYQAYMAAHKSGKPVPPEYDMQKEQYAYRVMGTMLRHQPTRLIAWMTIGKFGAMYGRTWEGGMRNVLTLTWGVQGVLVVFGFSGVLLAFRDERLRLPALLVVVGTVALLPFVPEPRFVFGFFPLLAVLAAGALQRTFGRHEAQVASAV